MIIADDHNAIVRGIRSILEYDGKVRIAGVAQNGRSALIMVRELKPDVLILDYSLPEMNGLDVARAIQRERLPTQVLIYTMHDRHEVVSEVLRAGVRGVVLKSDPHSHLITALDTLRQNRSYFSPTVSDAVLEQFLRTEPTTAASILTPKEREVVQLIAEGRLNKQIAGAMGIAIKTVETHRSSAMHKLKIRTTAELVRWAVRTNLIEP